MSHTELYKRVEIDDKGSVEPVQYVGVYALNWHDHPDRPECGFVEFSSLKDILMRYQLWSSRQVILDIDTMEDEDIVNLYLNTLDENNY